MLFRHRHLTGTGLFSDRVERVTKIYTLWMQFKANRAVCTGLQMDRGLIRCVTGRQKAIGLLLHPTVKIRVPEVLNCS
jgi:hypothetical protein